MVRKFQSSLIVQDNEWHVVGNLFNSDRLAWADEAVFLMNMDRAVVSLGLICKLCPCVVSYYSFPAHRGKGNGYALLAACIDRICETNAEAQIVIEPTCQTVDNHIGKLPGAIRRKLFIM